MPRFVYTKADRRHILRQLDPLLVSHLAKLAGDDMGTIKHLLLKAIPTDRQVLSEYGYLTMHGDQSYEIDLGIIDLINEAAKVCAYVAQENPSLVTIELDPQYD